MGPRRLKRTVRRRGESQSKEGKHEYIGKVGAFCFLDGMPAEESVAFCRRVERMGYKVLWAPEAWGCDPSAQGGYLLAKTDRLIYATGIANI